MKMQQSCFYVQSTATTATKVFLPTLILSNDSQAAIMFHRLMSNNYVLNTNYVSAHTTQSSPSLLRSLSLSLSLSLFVRRASMPINTLEASLSDSMSYNDASQQVPSKQNPKMQTLKRKRCIDAFHSSHPYSHASRLVA